MSAWNGLRALAGSIALLHASAPLSGEEIDPRSRPRQAIERPATGFPGGTVSVSKVSERDIVVAGTFSVARPVLFDALTRPEHLTRWMGADGMTLADAEVEPRRGGSLRYVFQRPGGRRIEVRGAYRTFDPPRGFAYLETYDFSPLRVDVTATLEEAGRETRLTQTLRYASTRERDEDFEPVASSSRQAYANLARYLASRQP
jgi:uncharacterized protein YndB with AHSA1/START domain